MRCKKHYTDVSSSIGVCACCLRERLLSLVAAEEQQANHNHNLDDGKHRIPSSAGAAPAAVHHAPRHHHTLSDQQFFSTTIPPKQKTKSFIRFFSFQNIFRSKNTDSVSDQNTATSSSTSTSWFSTILHGGRHHRHRRKPSVSVDESDLSGVIRRQYYRDRGMSPVRNSDLGNEDVLQIEINDTPKRTPLRRHGGGGGGGGGHVRNLSFCLSPLVRASPNRQRNQPEIAVAGDIRGPHLMNTKSFCANRSRKLADFGRTNPNR